MRVVHDATHGLHVNDRIRVRDAQTYPTGADLKVALEHLPGAYFSLSGDIARAHRLVRVRRQDWCRQACRSTATSMIFLNTVGTFGLASASYWWFRLMSGLGRLLYYSHGRDATTLLSYVDDLIWLTQSPFGLIRILASIFLLEILGMPFAWKKFRGGTEHSWIGFSVFAFERRLGISQSRADWLIGWIRRTRAEGRVRIADLSAVVGRLSFAFTAAAFPAILGSSLRVDLCCQPLPCAQASESSFSHSGVLGAACVEGAQDCCHTTRGQAFIGVLQNRR